MTDNKYPELPEPDSYIFQHEETGLTQFVDAQQVEWGFEKNNPRWKKVGEAYTKSQVIEAIDADRAMRAGEPAAVGSLNDENEALDLLEILFDAWENGIPCYEDPESHEEFIGNAFRLDDSVFHRCCNLLNRRRSKHATQTAQQPLTDAEIETVIDNSIRMHRHHLGLVRGQMFTAADSAEFWVVKATEAAHGIQPAHKEQP